MCIYIYIYIYICSSRARSQFSRARSSEVGGIQFAASIIAITAIVATIASFVVIAIVAIIVFIAIMVIIATIAKTISHRSSKFADLKKPPTASSLRAESRGAVSSNARFQAATVQIKGLES